MVDEGRLTEAEAEAHPQRNVITRAIGGGEDAPQLDKVTGRIRAGDRFLLCSDGVCKTLPTAQLAGLLSAGMPAGPLLAAVLDRLPSDNVTALVVDVV